MKFDKGTFLGDYLDYMSETETPRAYDMWAALWLMGNAIGRNCIIDRPRAPVFFNWYVILTAESGVTRKSTAVRAATNMLADVSEQNGWQLDIAQTRMSPEALEIRLHDLTREFGHSHMVVSVSELVTAMGREGYLRGMPGLLTDLYDCHERRMGIGTNKFKGYETRNLFVSLLSASTPTWLIKSINPDVIEGGFTSRVMFIHEERRKKRVPWPTEGANDGEVRNSLLGHLTRLRTTAARVGKVRITDGGLRAFDTWYRRRSESLDAFRSSFESREDAHVLRLAGCFAANDGKWQIERHHITRATGEITRVKETSASLFDVSATTSSTMAAIDRVRQLLLQAGLDGITQTRITVSCQHICPAERVRLILDILYELDMVQLFETSIGPGRPKRIWRATNKITGQHVMEQILREIEPI